MPLKENQPLCASIRCPPSSSRAACTLPSALFAQTGDSSSSTSALSSQAKAGATVPPAQVFAKLLSGEEKEIVDAAGAMPPDKFNFAPGKAMGTFDGVRTFSSQVKHLTEANYGFFHGFGVAGGKSRADIEKLTGRDEILQALKDSYTYAHAAIATITAENAFLDMDGKGTTRAGMAAYLARAQQRPLRPDGRVPAHERHHPTGQPALSASWRAFASALRAEYTVPGTPGPYTRPAAGSAGYRRVARSRALPTRRRGLPRKSA